MALRSVVLAPPPGGAGGPRRTVVLRPGAPEDKGKGVDIATLVVGALLLLACIGLVQVLPNKQYALPQFSVTFPEMTTNSSSSRFDFLDNDEASRIHDFTFDLPGNVHSITIVAFFEDDLAASLPDRFRMELFDPSGSPFGPRYDLVNANPLYVQNASNPTQTPHYEAGAIVGGRYVIPVGLHPEDQIVQGLSHREVAEQVKARLEPQHRIASQGTWTVRITLLGADDCPEPGTPDVLPQQVFFCRIAAPNGQDPGNSFSLENFIYTTYKVEVKELS